MRISAIIVTALFLTSCLTPKVWNKAFPNLIIEGEKVYKAEDQTLAIEAKVTGSKGSSTKFYAKDGKVLEAAQFRDVNYIYVSHDRNSWEEYASKTDLPVKFSDNVLTYAFSDPIPVKISGETRTIKMGEIISQKKDPNSKSFPYLLLLPPAVIGDVAIGIISAPFLLLVFAYDGIATSLSKKPR